MAHEGKTNREEETRAPDGTQDVKTVFSVDEVLVDEVDDEDAEEGAQAGDPIRKGDVDGDRVFVTRPPAR